MKSELDEVVQSISNATLETPQIILQSLLDQLYAECLVYGLTSSQLKTLIRYLCESPVLSVSTKVYIIENCLFPNDYISKEVSREVARHLGTATAISEFKLQTSVKVQVALCKWLVKVYFLLSPEPQEKYTVRDSDVWLHLWQFGYLQHWLTYILVWSSKTLADVKTWKIVLLKRTGLKPGYKNGAAYATFVLKRYESLTGKSKLISSVIDNLNCNLRTLRSLQDFEIDDSFMKKLQPLLIRTSPSQFTAEMINVLVTSHYENIRNMEKSEGNKLISRCAELDGIQLQSIESLNGLVWTWNKIIVPKDFEPFFLKRDSFPQLFYLLQISKHADISSVGYDWIKINLKRIFHEGRDAQALKATNDVIGAIIRHCQIMDGLVDAIIQDFLTIKNLLRNTEVFIQIWTGVFAVLNWNRFKLADHQSVILEILAYCHLDKNIRNIMFSRLCDSITDIIWYSRNGEGDSNISSAIEIMQFALALLISDLQSVLDRRCVIVSIIRIIKILGTCEDGIRVLSPVLLNRLLIGDDPLLLNASCLYLIKSKEVLLQLEPEHKLVKCQNHFIMDLTNYLWRNKVLNARLFLGIPIDFLRSVIQNLYLPNTESKSKSVFSITGIASLSYASIVMLAQIKLKRTGSTKDVPQQVEGRKEFYTKQFDKKEWLAMRSQITGLKVELLKEYSTSSPYAHIASFLFTYLKSLSKYSRG